MRIPKNGRNTKEKAQQKGKEKTVSVLHKKFAVF